MSRLFRFSSRIAVAVALIAVCSVAQASVFSGIGESSSTGDPLFGPSKEVGPLAIDFDPTDFKSITIGQGSQIIDSQLSFTVSGVPILGIKITERGDYALAGAGGAEAEATVRLHVFWEVEEVNGLPLSTPRDGQATITIGNFSLPGDGTAGGLWQGGMDVDIAGFLVDEEVGGVATLVSFTLDNPISTAATTGGAAFIAKKDFDIEVIIPEPASGALAGLGMVGLMMGHRRRRLA